MLTTSMFYYFLLYNDIFVSFLFIIIFIYFSFYRHLSCQLLMCIPRLNVLLHFYFIKLFMFSC